MEHRVGSTDLRQRLTDVLEAVRERRETYIIETFGRPQAAVINLEEYRRFQRFQREREAFFDRLEAAATSNAERNRGLSEDEVLSIIEQARAVSAARDAAEDVAVTG